MGVAWLVFSSEEFTGKIDTGEETGETPEYGSFLWREEQEQRQKRNKGPGYGIRDVVSY
jgi:hypothetical protein